MCVMIWHDVIWSDLAWCDLMQVRNECKTETAGDDWKCKPVQICQVDDQQIRENTEKKLLTELAHVSILPIERLESVETANQEWKYHHIVAEIVDEREDKVDLGESQTGK